MALAISMSSFTTGPAWSCQLARSMRYASRLHLLEDQLAGTEEVVNIDAEKEAANLRHVSVPAPQPSEEIEKHRAVHYPYRKWCQQCVQGCGVGMPHSTGCPHSTVAIVAVDSFFMRPKA